MKEGSDIVDLQYTNTTAPIYPTISQAQYPFLGLSLRLGPMDVDNMNDTIDPCHWHPCRVEGITPSGGS